MKLILIRHGNTFGPDDAPVWVGKNEDLPLVPSGKAQAEALAQAILQKEASSSPAIIYSSPLQRAQQTAEAFGKVVVILPELQEVDYGAWGGKATDELVSLGFQDAVEKWDHEAVIPTEAGWGSTEEELKHQVDAFLSRTEPPLQIVVTSNGFLKCLARFRLNAFSKLCEEGNLKVRTGHLCELALSDGTWQVQSWGISPTEFLMK